MNSDEKCTAIIHTLKWSAYGALRPLSEYRPKDETSKGPTLDVCIRPPLKRPCLSYFGKVFKSKHMNSKSITQNRGDFLIVCGNSFGMKICLSALSNLNWIICKLRRFEISVRKYDLFVWQTERF